MTDSLERRTVRGTQRFELTGQRQTIGADASNSITIDDASVSRLHAVLENYGSGWTVRDLGSANGTSLNGERLVGERTLHDGDSLSVGLAEFVFRDGSEKSPRLTDRPARPPFLTRREREVLVELCRPVLRGDVFTEPASIQQIATALGVSGAAIKQHLASLYGKFEIDAGAELRRVRLANSALHRGAVSLGDLHTG